MAAPLHQLDYQAPDDDHMLTVLRVGGYEAALAAARLRGEGIDCFIADENFSATDPLVAPDVRVQVRSRDFDRAKALLAEPAQLHDDEDGLPTRGGGGDEYAEETWRCPKCHRKTVDQLPLPPAWGFFRNAFWFVLLVPPIAFGIGRLAFHEVWDERMAVVDSLACPWAAVVLGLSLPLILRDRGKRCTSCGHAWNKSGPLSTPLPVPADKR